MNKKDKLKDYLVGNMLDNYSIEEAMKLIENMNVYDVIDAMDEAQEIIEVLKNTPLGKELI